MSRNSIKIPPAHFERFKLFVNLPDVIIDNIVEVISTAPVGISESALFELLKKNVKDLATDKLTEFYSIYVSLSGVKESLELTDQEFFEDVEYAMKASKDFELEPSVDRRRNIEKIFTSKRNIQESRSFVSESLENEHNFSDVKIITDLRTVFEQEKFIGTTIVNKLKITYKTGTVKKNLYIAIDGDDIAVILSALKEAQEKNEYLRSSFPDLKIVNIIR